MTKLHVPFHLTRHLGWFRQLPTSRLSRVSSLGLAHRKTIAATGIIVLVFCILGVGQRLRSKVQQQTNFLESELILSVHAFNQLQREVLRLHEQMLLPEGLTTPKSIQLHKNLVQSRIYIISKRLEAHDKSEDLGPELSSRVEQIIQDWQTLRPLVARLEDDLTNQSLRRSNATALRALELDINQFTLLNQHRNRNRYTDLLKEQRNSLHWLFALLFVFLILVSIFTIYVLRFIRIRHQMLEEMKRLSSTDELTQIPNRRQFNEAFAEEWHRMMREGLFLSIILCDIDYFKRYNDHYGHQAGDVCLQRVAQALQQGMCRAGDFVARYGGEEFVIILPDTSLESALEVAARLQEQVSGLDLEHAQSAISSHLTLSLGVASGMPSPAVQTETVLKYADQALYEAKAQGRDRACAKAFDVEQVTSQPN